MTTESTVKINFDPAILDRRKANEINMSLEFNAPNIDKEYWCECDVAVRAPLSLSHDVFLEKGRTRVGIISPGRKTILKHVKLFSSPAMSSNDYLVTITTYLYDEEGTIADRRDSSEIIKCGVMDISERQ